MPVCYWYLYSPAPLFFNRLIYFGIYVFYSEKQSYVTKRKNTEWYLVWVQHLLKRKHVGHANLWHSLSPSPAAVCNEGSCFGNYEQEEWKGMDSFLHFGTMLSVLHLVINSHGPFWKGSRFFSFFFLKTCLNLCATETYCRQAIYLSFFFPSFAFVCEKQ